MDRLQSRPTSCNGPRLSGNRAAGQRCGCQRLTLLKSMRKRLRQSLQSGRSRPVERKSPRILVGATSRAGASSSQADVRLGSADLQQTTTRARFRAYALKITQCDGTESSNLGVPRGRAAAVDNRWRYV